MPDPPRYLSAGAWNNQIENGFQEVAIMFFTYSTDIQSIHAHQDSHFRRAGSGRGARADSSLTVISRALRRARREEEGASRHGMR